MALVMAEHAIAGSWKWTARPIVVAKATAAGPERETARGAMDSGATAATRYGGYRRLVGAAGAAGLESVMYAHSPVFYKAEGMMVQAEAEARKWITRLYR